MTHGARTILIPTAAAALLAAGVATYAWHESRRPSMLEAYVFDTSGMPAIFIRTEDDRRFLVGGGANADIVHRLTEILPFYSRRIDEIVAVNDDPRNVTGLIEVVNRYEVRAVSLADATSTDPAYGVFLNRLAQKGIELRVISNGDLLASTSLRLYDMKKSVFTFAAGRTVLIVPFSLANITQKMLAETKPDYIVYSAQIPKNPRSAKSAQSRARQKTDILAGILMDRRYNVREAGTIKMTVRDGRLEIGNVGD